MTTTQERHGTPVDRTRWLMLETALEQGAASAVLLRYKGHQLHVCMVECTNSVVLHIDGEPQPVAINDDSPQLKPVMRDVWRKRTRRLWTPTERAALVKQCGGEAAAQEKYRNLDKVVVSWRPDFPSVRALTSKLAKLPGVELLEVVNAG